MIRASDLVDGLGESNNPQWKTVAVNTAGELVVPNGSIGFRWGEKGKWNLESIAAGTETELSLTLLGQHDAVWQAWPSPTLAALKNRIFAA
ncbi:hypothetical protein ACLBR5_20070 [Escherichia coli]